MVVSICRVCKEWLVSYLASLGDVWYHVRENNGQLGYTTLCF